MKALTSTFGILLLSMLVLNNSMAQQARFTTHQGMSIGFGGGYAYQKSDLFNSKGFGFDFSLGSQLYQKENAFLAVDWKFRFLAGANKAYDHRINPDNSYSNIRYSFFNYDLELGLTLNRLRERTGIVLTGFAGAGITHGRTFSDLYDAGGNVYDFSTIDPDRNSKLVYEDLVRLSDGEFETRLVNKAAILPTAGLFFGYQLSRSLILGFEYKTNFYLTEKNSLAGIDLDNRIVSGSRMDRNSYISMGFRWNLRGSAGHNRTSKNYSTGGNTHHVNSANTGNLVVPVSLSPPMVEFTDPSANPFYTESNFHTVRAIVDNVTGAENISFYQNGFNNNSFTYNANTKTFIANVTLSEGENRFRIKAANQVSSVEDLAIITLNHPQEAENEMITSGFNETGSTQDQPAVYFEMPRIGAIPTVRFINPATPVEVIHRHFPVRAEIRNVSSRDDVTVILNGAMVDNFSFESRSTIAIPLILPEGTSTLEIIARNGAGIASESTFITYHVPVYSQTGYNQPAYIQPVSNQPVNNDPAYTEPVYTESVNIEPVIREGATRPGMSREVVTHEGVTYESANREGVTHEPPVRERLNRQRITHERANLEPVYSEPVRSEPVRSEPVRSEPVRSEPVNRDRANRQSGNRQNINHQPVNHQPVISTSPPETNITSPGTPPTKVSDPPEEVENAIRINPGNAAWQFCLVTTSGTYSRENLTNTNFSYSGSASSLYFQPIGGNGVATVNGRPYTIRPGQYYHFTGNLRVTVSTKNPGSMGHWSVYINADREPVAGNGQNRPTSPCEPEINASAKGKGNRR